MCADPTCELAAAYRLIWDNADPESTPVRGVIEDAPAPDDTRGPRETAAWDRAVSDRVERQYR